MVEFSERRLLSRAFRLLAFGFRGGLGTGGSNVWDHMRNEAPTHLRQCSRHFFKQKAHMPNHVHLHLSSIVKSSDTSVPSSKFLLHGGRQCEVQCLNFLGCCQQKHEHGSILAAHSATPQPGSNRVLRRLAAFRSKLACLGFFSGS